MYIAAGEKTYLLTDYCPTRKYSIVRFTDGNGKQWYQLEYRWLFWTFYLLRLTRHADTGPTGKPMEFKSLEDAQQHLERERKYVDREERSHQVVSEIVG